MKRIVTLIIASCILCGQVSAMTKTTTQSNRLDSEYINDRVSEIYNSLNETKNPEAKFTSEQFYKLWQTMQAKDAILNEVGFVSSNHWYQAQDFEKPHYEFGTAEKISGTTAIVSLTINDLGSSRKLILLMVYERGNWYVDDFITEERQLFRSEKAALKRYLQ